MSLVFDIEADSLLDGVSRVLCIAIGGKIFHDQAELRPRDGSLEQGLSSLGMEDELVGHNCQGYDLPVLLRLYSFKPKAFWFDTAIAARLAFPDIAVEDKGRKDFPSRLTGHHSLEAWGYRLGLHKGERPESFDVLNEDMLKYCLQDVVVTKALYEYLKDKV